MREDRDMGKWGRGGRRGGGGAGEGGGGGWGGSAEEGHDEVPQFCRS